MPNAILIAGAVALLAGILLVASRAMSRSPLGRGDDLSVSRSWLVEHQSRNGSE